MRISLVVAMARNRVIGRRGALPWRIPADLRRFRALTTGHPIIMGRRTFESIGGPLPERRNLVLSRRPGFSAAGVEVHGSLEEALAAAAGSGAGEVIIIGGAGVYAAALARADRIHLTLIDADYEGDTVFPELPPGRFHESAREDHPGPPPFSFITLEKNA